MRTAEVADWEEGLMDNIQIYAGDNRIVLKTIADNSVDSVVTDPPYELGFMGKKWDSSGIAYDVAMWHEVLRVLKPGGFLLSFGGTRTYHRMVCAIEDAGFEIRDSIHWTYGQGFPKSLNIEKLFCACGVAEPYNHYLCNYGTEKKPEHNLRPLRQTDLSEAVNSKNKSGEVLQPVLPEQSSYETMLRKEPQKGFPTGEEPCMERRRDDVQKEGQLQEYPLRESAPTDQADGAQGWLYNGTQINNGDNVPEVTKQDGSGASFRSQSREQLPEKSGIMAGQFNSQKGRTRKVCDRCGKHFPPYNVTGYGTALKPAHEIICVARKPVEGTVAQNVLKYGTGGMNIDGCRIDGQPHHNYGRTCAGGVFTGKSELPINTPSQGRFPSNFIHDGSKEVVNQFPEQTSGAMKKPYTYTNTGSSMGAPTGKTRAIHESNSGSASRFFKTCEFTEDDIPAFIYCAKASRSEREEGCEDIQAKQQDTSQKDGSPGGDNPRNRGVYLRTNNHPTVKPLTLMRYLIKLVTPPGGTVLDPFVGSGTTLVACVKEGFIGIGIELDPSHIEIVEARVNGTEPDKPEITNQLSLFGND